jgi:hypothetical protein
MLGELCPVIVMKLTLTHVVVAVAGVLVLGNVALIATIYLRSHVLEHVTQSAQIPRSAPRPAAPAVSDGATQSLAAVKAIKDRLDDEWATGEATGAAEWSTGDDDQYPTLCGVSPTDRYIITQNPIGRAVHHEPSEHDWEAVGCARTSPVHQRVILAEQRRQADEELAQEQARRKKIEDWSTCQLRVIQSHSDRSGAIDDDAVKSACGENPVLAAVDALIKAGGSPPSAGSGN